MKLAFLLLFTLTASYAAEARFETASFAILIDQRCPEGSVSCDHVKYVGTSKKTGKSITLIGSTVHSYGPDGVTPTQFQGFRFKNGSVEYFVSEHGYLEVTNGEKLLLHEAGKWDWQKKEPTSGQSQCRCCAPPWLITKRSAEERS